ncbi:unnamed protein product [Oncorhynchus mykiss]|uniref:EGF-like domain-containing protein n=1 Tax=Oncorhynchus mykiss TaxID=8022 RepID=A0A060WZ65_ONCMY|nr:unnamed protein product [Oncorhynchus mykiss]
MVNIGGEICTYPVGYTLQGAAECLDIDECKGDGPGPCILYANCTNTPGSYLCKCLRGYLMGTGGCQDIDECALAEVTGLQVCGSGADCRNTPGSFSCSCPIGYVMALDGHSCVDVDECSFEEQCRRELGNVCVNTPGSFVCQPGFRAEVPACIGLTHPYLRYQLQPSSSTCNICFASHILLKVPKAHTPLGHSSFQFAASSHWNEL